MSERESGPPIQDVGRDAAQGKPEVRNRCDEPDKSPRIDVYTPLLFGTVDVRSEPHDAALVVANVGDAPLTILAAPQFTENPDGVFALDGGGTVIAPGGRHEYPCRFAPIKKGPRAAKLEIRSNDPDHPIKLAALMGSGRLELEIGIRESPRPAVLLDRDSPGTLVLHAIDKSPAEGGKLEWFFPIDTGAVAIRGGAAGNDLTLATLESGSQTVRIRHRYDEFAVEAETTVDVVAVRVLEESPLHVLLLEPGGGAGTRVVHAQGSPEGGTYAWPPIGGAAAGYQPLPGRASEATVEAAADGLVRCRVNYTLGGVTAHAEVDVQVVSVSIDVAPEVGILLHAPGAGPNTQEVVATGRPGGGEFAWRWADGTAAQFPGAAAPGDVNRVTVESRQAGTSTLAVSYTCGTDGGQVTAEATVLVHVVTVVIQEAPAAPPPPAPGGGPAPPPNPNPRLIQPSLADPGFGWAAANSAQRHLNAVGTPANDGAGANGVYAWRANHAARIRFQGGAPPGDNAQATIESVAHGAAARFEVDYTVAGVTATAHVDVDSKPDCTRSRWQPAVAAGVGLGAVPIAPSVVAPQADAPRCLHTPQANFQRPHFNSVLNQIVPPAGTANVAMHPTAVPAEPHHHGGYCSDCSVAVHGEVRHWVDPDIAGHAAAAQALILRDQIHRAVQNWIALPAAGRFAASNAWTLAQGLPWLSGIRYGYFQLTPANSRRPTMIGVLHGTNVAGQAVRLRAISGQFPQIQTAQPNDYWSPELPARNTISSATRGARLFGAVAGAAWPVGNTFGGCAASKLLTHALHLGLEIDSMAEIWVGVTQNGRHDAQLQASCNQCRRYLGFMLCEYGGQGRTDAFAAGAAGVPAVPPPNPPFVGVPPNRGF